VNRLARLAHVLKKVALAAGVLLGIFHVKLLAGHALSGQLSDPGLLLRWLLAAALVVGLVVVRRQGKSIVRSRDAVAIWLLAALLHGPSLVSRFDAVGAPALPEASTLAQAAAASVAALGFGLLLVFFVARRRLESRRRVYVAASTTALVGALDVGTYFLFSPRPPPA